MITKLPERCLDLGLVHTYGHSEDGFHPNLRGRIVNNAAAELFNRGLIDTIVVAGGKIAGPQKPDISLVAAADLHERLGIPNNRITALPKITRADGQVVEVRSTKLEIEALMQVARLDGTRNIASVADSLHMRYVQSQHLKMETGVKTYNAARILLSLESPRIDYLDQLIQLEVSHDQLVFGLQEDLKNFIDSFPLMGNLLDYLAQKLKTKPNLGGR